MNEVVNLYSSSEEDLYTVTGMIYQNAVNDLPLLSKHKKRYTIAFLDALLKQRDAAAALPNLDQRQSQQDVLNNEVDRRNADCCDDLRSLLTYINTDSFPAADVDAMKKKAGEEYYGTASKGNWQSTKTMMGMMITFMGEYPDQLAKAEMPDTLPAACTEHLAAFNTALDNFNNYKNQAPQETAAKVTANNNLYIALQAILTDGKYIHRTDPLMRKLYSYTALVNKIRKKKTGYHLKLTDATTGKPIEGATISLVQSDKTEQSNKRGVVNIELAEGNYDYTILATGYTPVYGTLEVNKNVMHREYLTLQKATATAATA